MSVVLFSRGIVTAPPGLGILPDSTPDPFSFIDQTNVALSTLITSAAITVTGINVSSPITVSGGTYSINGGAFTSSAGTVLVGDSVRAQVTSSSSNSTPTNCVVTIGGVSDTFTATTVASGGFARKPVIPTPSLPTPLRTLYVTAGAADGGDGSVGSPFNTVQAAEAISTAGDEINLDGAFDVTGDIYLGMYGHAGTAAHPIVYRKKPGASVASVKFGGGVNQQNTISFNTGADHNWFVGLYIQIQSGADGRHGSKVRGANNIKFIGCEWNACGVWASDCANYEMWDCVTSGDFGSPSDTTSDVVAIRDGAVDSRIMRLVQTGNGGHTSFIVYDQFAASATPKPVLRTEIFDCVIRNPWQGGLQLLGGSGFSHVHWCDIRESATNPLGTSPTSKEGMEVASSDNLIEFNWVHGGAGYGIALETLIVNGITEVACRNIVRHCVITDNQYVGLVFTAGVFIDVTTSIIDNKIYNNVIANNSRAIFPSLSGDANLNQSGGYFNGHYNPIVLFLANGTSFWATGNFYGNEFKNNLLSVDPSVDTLVAVHMRRFPADGDSVDYTNADLVTGGAGGSNILQTTPNFVSSINVRLNASSAAINAGFAYSGSTFLGAAPDIGIYEYGGSD